MKNQAPASGVSHKFKEKTFRVPTFCWHCGQLMVGFRKQGLRCEGKKQIKKYIFESHKFLKYRLVCGFDCHRKCSKHALKNCKSLTEETNGEHSKSQVGKIQTIEI